MTAVFISFRKGPSDRPDWPRAVGVPARFADEKGCRHPDFTVTEIGDHRDSVVTEIGDHTDFDRTPTCRSMVLRPALVFLPRPFAQGWKSRPRDFSP